MATTTISIITALIVVLVLHLVHADLHRSCLKNRTTDFIHPGLLHTDADFEFVRFWVQRGYEPYKSGWNRLLRNRHSHLGYQPGPAPIMYRGYNGVNPENYLIMDFDASAAYKFALLWKISGDHRWADVGVRILNAYGNVLKKISGTNDGFLLAGLQGYQFATAGEIFKSYSGWDPSGYRNFTQMMLNVFWPMNRAFITRDRAWDMHFWSNWELCHLCSALAIGVLTDRPEIYNLGINYWFTGKGTGAINQTLWITYADGTAQNNESGRDQGHATLSMVLEMTFCQMAWTQGCDLFSYDDSRVLKGSEYMAKYNLGYDVQYTRFRAYRYDQPIISNGSRGIVRPMWELPYNHYRYVKGLPLSRLTYTKMFADKIRPEGGGTDYGWASGGFDQLGCGTLMYSKVIPNATLWEAYLRNKTIAPSSSASSASSSLRQSGSSSSMPEQQPVMQSAVTKTIANWPTSIFIVTAVSIAAALVMSLAILIRRQRRRKNRPMTNAGGQGRDPIAFNMNAAASADHHHLQASFLHESRFADPVLESNQGRQ